MNPKNRKNEKQFGELKYDPSATPTSNTEILMLPFRYDFFYDDENKLAIITAVAECLQKLKQSDREVLEVMFYDMTTYQQLADTIGVKAKSHAWKKTQNALKKLEQLLKEHPQIKEHIYGTPQD